MSSFRKGKAEASLRLYSLPRRELQALCKQYGIPTNKTNVALADALAAVVPVDIARGKASMGANSLRVLKTTPMKKLNSERTTGLASFTSNGKRNISPLKLAYNATPSRRGLKRPEGPAQTLLEDRTKATAAPAFPRAAALLERLRKSAAAASSLKAPTPRKRPTPRKPTPRKPSTYSQEAKVVATVPRGGGDALPPVFSRGSGEPKHHPEPERETVGISYAEIEFKNAALHKELFGVRRNAVIEENRDVSPVAREADRREDVSESSLEVGFEVRDLALHKEHFGSQGYAHSPLDLEGPGAAADAMDLVSSKRGICNSPVTEVLDYRSQDVRVLSSIREDASDDSGSKAGELEEHTHRHLSQGRDLGPLLDNVPCGGLAESRCEKGMEGPELVMPGPSHVGIPGTPSRTSIQNNTVSPLGKAVTPLTKVRNNIDSTLAKATAMLEKLACLRADAEKKEREGYWEPKFSSVVENASPAAVYNSGLVLDRDLPSAKKARLTPEALVGAGKGLVVCEDAGIVSKGEIPSFKTVLIPHEARDVSLVSDKENQSEKSMEDRNSRKLGGLVKEKVKKFEVLKDRSKNFPDHVRNDVHNATGATKLGPVGVRPEEMSLRKLRAQFKEKIRHLETSKGSDLWSQRGAWNRSH